MRVVSLTCSNTEIVCALGLSHLLVGVDDHSDHPVDVVGRLPRLGPDLSIDVEGRGGAETRPGAGFVDGPGPRAGGECASSRWSSVVAPDPESVADVSRDVRDIGRWLGHPARGDDLADELSEALGAELSPPRGRRPSVLVEWWPKPVIAPGRRSWVTDLLWRAGGVNPLGEDDCPSRPVTDAEVASWAPEAIVICWCGVPFAKYRPDVVERRAAWADTPALRNGQIHCVPEAWLGRPGPRLVQGLRALREVVLAVG